MLSPSSQGNSEAGEGEESLGECVLGTEERHGGWGKGGEMTQTLYAHMNK
jgi:hypothetical protein